MLKRAVGRNAATRKYDMLTILGAFALSQDKRLQRQVLRLICLITARYNWQNDELSIGQTEIARLWSVEPRTVKREMAALRNRGWLVEKRPAARGRVTLYGLGSAQILEDTRPVWERVGPDLVARLGEGAPAEVAPSNVIPFAPGALPQGEGLWPRIAARLAADHPVLYRSWFAHLSAGEPSEEALQLRAASGFQASYISTHLSAILEAVARAEAGRAIEIRIEG